MTVDARVNAAAMEIADEVTTVAGTSLVGCYVHGSAVLGDFLPERSDLELLVVVEDSTTEAVVDAVADVLLADRRMVATGLEVSVVDRSAAHAPRAPWPFRVHVTTDPRDRKRVSGRGHPGDADLVLHYLVARAGGWALTGAAVEEVFGSVPEHVVVGQLVAELRWAAVEASESYAVLNACRALRFQQDGTVYSKTAAGKWAIESGIAPDLVQRALTSRQAESAAPVSVDAHAWILAVANELEGS